MKLIEKIVLSFIVICAFIYIAVLIKLSLSLLEHAKYSCTYDFNKIEESAVITPRLENENNIEHKNISERKYKQKEDL